MTPYITINVKFELDKASYKKFRADMESLEAEMKLKNNLRVAGEDLKCGDFVHVKSDGKFYKSDVLKNMMSPERNAEITAELERCIRTGELSPESIGHIPATLKDVCGWWIHTDLKGVSGGSAGNVSAINYHMKEILKIMK